jgi:hypothetical protein
MCDEHGIGGSGEYCGDNDAHLGRINVLYHEALGGRCDAYNLVSHRGVKILGRRPLKNRAKYQFI